MKELHPIEEQCGIPGRADLIRVRKSDHPSIDLAELRLFDLVSVDGWTYRIEGHGGASFFIAGPTSGDAEYTFYVSQIAPRRGHGWLSLPHAPPSDNFRRGWHRITGDALTVESVYASVRLVLT